MIGSYQEYEKLFQDQSPEQQIITLWDNQFRSHPVYNHFAASKSGQIIHIRNEKPMTRDQFRESLISGTVQWNHLMQKTNRTDHGFYLRVLQRTA